MTNDVPKPPGQLWKERRTRSSNPKPVSDRKQINFRLSLEAGQKLQALIESLELVTATQNPITGELAVNRAKYSRHGFCRALLEKAI